MAISKVKLWIRNNFLKDIQDQEKYTINCISKNYKYKNKFIQKMFKDSSQFEKLKNNFSKRKEEINELKKNIQ